MVGPASSAAHNPGSIPQHIYCGANLLYATCFVALQLAAHAPHHASCTMPGPTHAGICMAVYGATGFFGASSFGEDTKGDVLQNEIIGGTPAVVLISAVAAYLAVGQALLPADLRCVHAAELCMAPRLRRWRRAAPPLCPYRPM